ncbi:MAG TPA: 2-oxo acid dehydrogenase subunit E2 [Edaphobacter sp.]|nr:2-oxo acid dehydrogenase subunit E2 [Edaphobacter sp.]
MSAGTPILLERDNVNDEVVTLVRWFVPNGEKVDEGTLIAEIETSKANVEVQASHAGYLQWGFSERADVLLTEPLGHIFSEPVPADALLLTAPKLAETSSSLKQPAFTPSVDTASPGGNNGEDRQTDAVPVFSSVAGYETRFSRRAQGLMLEHGIPEDRFSAMALVRTEDVLALIERRPGKNTSKSKDHGLSKPPESGPRIVGAPKLPVIEVPLSRMKRSEGQALASGTRNAIPSAVSVTCFTRGLRAALESNSVVAGNVGAVIVYEVARLLRKYPAFNATYRPNTMLQYEQVNIGYAMDDGRGLKVAVLQDCDQKSLSEITSELRGLVLGYLEDKLNPSQISGGTFTISDLSGSGVSSFLPLISEDQGAILGVSSEQFSPGEYEGSYNLTLAFDHQLSEGRTAVLFLNDLKDRLLHYEKAMAGGGTIVSSVVCARCGRGVDELPDAKSYMVRTSVPLGHLCNLCIAGF